jgi:hypothetical protein
VIKQKYHPNQYSRRTAPAAHYRQKDDQKVKGYSVNVTESCGENSPLNLIAHVGIKKASVSDVDFLQESIEKA